MIWLAITTLSLAAYGLTYVPTRRVGGLVFWRIGRIGGSVYVSRNAGV